MPKKDSQMCQILDGFFWPFFAGIFLTHSWLLLSSVRFWRRQGLGGGSRNPLQGWTPSFLKKQGIFYGYEVRKIRNTWEVLKDAFLAEVKEPNKDAWSQGFFTASIKSKYI